MSKQKIALEYRLENMFRLDCNYFDFFRVFLCCDTKIFSKYLITVERRRRFNINDRIKELGTLLPKNNGKKSMR